MRYLVLVLLVSGCASSQPQNGKLEEPQAKVYSCSNSECPLTKKH